MTAFILTMLVVFVLQRLVKQYALDKKKDEDKAL